MRNITTGTIIGILVAVALAGVIVAVLDVTGRTGGGPQAPGMVMARFGPDGTDATFYGDDMVDVAIPESRHFDFCLGELRVERPSMMTTDMPDSFCTLTRAEDGLWHISTGGWQACQAVCFRKRES